RAQPAQRDLDLADVEHEIRAIGLEAPRVRDAHRASASAFRPDAQAARVGALGAERARPSGADPAISTVVPFLLLAEPLLEEPAQLFHVDRLEHGELLRRQIATLEWVGKPLLDLVEEFQARGLNAAKVAEERLVERVEVCLAVHAERARDVIETVER